MTILFHRNLRRNSKGIGTVFAMVFFLLIVMLVFASFMVILNQNTGLEQTITQTRQIDQDRANEQLTISPQTDGTSLYTVNTDTNSVTINVILNNTGTLPVQVIRLWIKDVNNSASNSSLVSGTDGVLIQGQANPYTGVVTFPITAQIGLNDQFIFWFETSRGNQFTLGQSNRGISQINFNQQLSEVLGDFLPDYNSVEWAFVTTTNGVSTAGPWQSGWIIPTGPDSQSVAFRLNLTYYGDSTLRIDNDTDILFSNLQATSVVFEGSGDGVYPTLFLSNYSSQTGILSSYSGNEITITPSTNPTPFTLYFSTIQNYDWSWGSYGSSGTIYPVGQPSPKGYPLHSIQPNAMMTLVLYGMSPSNYAQSFQLFAVQSRPISITINPESGTVGTSVAMNGNGFAANSGITVKIDSTQITIPTTTTNNNGVFSVTFTVPAAAAGNHTITATDNSPSKNAAIATFTVTPNLITSPASGPSGTSVTASGTGFAANSPITVTFAGTTVSTSPSTVVTDATGSFSSATFIVPSSTAGVKTINVTDANGNSDTASFTVIVQSIALNPTSGNIGTTVTVSGSNFLPNSPLTVTYDGVTVDTSTSTGSGALPSGVTFPVPTSTFGGHVVRVTDGFGNYATATFSVTASINLSPTTGSVGTPVIVSGQGFGALKTITLTFAGTAIATSPSPVTTDNSGSFVASFNVPTGSTTSSVAGAKSVVASDSSSTPNSASATFTVTPFITLAPTSGSTGTVVTVSGTGYGAAKAMTIKYGSSTMTTSPTTVTTTAFGTFSCTFTVPASAAGLNTVTGTDSSSNADTETFTIIPTITTLSPTNGGVGSTVTVSGTGFGGSKTITAKFDGVSVSLGGTTSTGATGSFTGATFVVPAATAGVHTVTITDSSSNSASSSFTVTSAVTLNPTSGNVGSSVTVSGTGFAGSSTITISYDGSAQGTTPATVTTGATGSFSATFNVPASIVGLHTVSASDGANAGSATFTVIQSITLNPTSGIVGSSVTVSGSGYTATSTITIKLNSTFTMVTTPSTVTTDVHGSFSASFTIPTGQTAGAKTVTATDASAKTATATFTLNPGPLNHFTFNTISSPQTAGTAFSITITAQDADGNTVTSYNSANALSVSSGTISPTSTDAFTGGVWTGSVTLTHAGTGIYISTTGDGKAGQSNTFTMNPGALASFSFSTISGSQTAGTPIAGVTITALDENDNTVTSYASSTTLTETDGGAGGSVTQSPITFSNGQWSGSLTVTKSGSDVTITATGGGQSGKSNTFTVNTAALSKFSFASIDTQIAGTAFNVLITAQDAYSNTVTTYTGNPTLTYSAGTINPTYSGNFVGGTQTVSVTVTNAGTGVSITATDGSTTGTSDTFIVNPGALDHFTLTASGGGNIADQTVDTAFSITVTAYDINNNVKTNYAGPATLSDLSSSIAPTSTGPFTNGIVTVSVTIANSYTSDKITATSGSISIQSNAFTVHKQVTFVSAGTGSGTIGNPTPTYPTGLQANDLILLQVTVRATTNTPTTPDGFTLLYGPDSTGTGRQWIYYKFSTGSESGTITVTIGGSACKMARMYDFRNVALSSFTEGDSFGFATSSTVLARPVTTTGNGELAVSMVFVNDDNAVNSFTGQSGGVWTEAVSEFTTTQGSDGCIQLQTATMPNMGTITGGSYSMAASDPWGVRAFALKPA